MEWVKDASKIVTVLCSVIPLMLGIGGLHIILYTRSPKYYFFVLKIISRWKDTNWKISTAFTVGKSVDAYGIFESILCDRYGRDKYKKVFNLKNKKLYEFSNFALTMQYDLDTSQSDSVQVELLFNNINVTYTGAKDMLKELRILFNSFERRISCSHKNYNKNIKYSSMHNPFYGLLIQRLGPEHVDFFECIFSLSVLEKKQLNTKNDGNNYKISVYKDYISINEPDFDAIEDVAKKCLLMG